MGYPICGGETCESTGAVMKFCNPVEDRCETCTISTCSMPQCLEWVECRSYDIASPRSDNLDKGSSSYHDSFALSVSGKVAWVVVVLLVILFVVALLRIRKLRNLLKIYKKITILSLQNFLNFKDKDKIDMLGLIRAVKSSPSHRVTFHVEDGNVKEESETQKLLIFSGEQENRNQGEEGHVGLPVAAKGSARCDCNKTGQQKDRRLSCPNLGAYGHPCNEQPATLVV